MIKANFLVLYTMAQPNSSKSPSVSICRFLFVALLLVVLPLFPSQAPEPINHTIVASIWELLHLLFIGIAVSYGLFGRKSSEIDKSIESRSENSQPFLSGISHVSRFFEDGSGNLSGYAEKSAIQPWNSNSQFKANVPEIVVVVEEWENQNPKSLVFADGSNEKMVSQTWNSQYFHGQSVVVVANEKGDVDAYGKSNPISAIDHKPLGLPVRKFLKSRNGDHVCDNNHSRPSSIGSFKSLDRRRNGKVRGLTPINLEKRFESVALLSPVPWRSRSKGDEIGGVKPAASHKRPLSVGAFDQLDYLQSQSFWSPIFSETNPATSPAKEVSHPPHNLPHSEEESIVGDKCFCENPQRVGAGSEMNLEGNSDAILKSHRSMRRNPPRRGRSKMVRSLIDTNHVNDGSPRSHSVRPFRSKEHVAEDEKMGKICLNQNIKKDSNKQNRDRLHPAKRSNLLEERQHEDKEEISDTNVCDFEMKLEDFEVSSEERQEEEEIAEGGTVSSNADVDGHDEEVDRKAGEFIAKLREQIRLQKVASSRGFGGC